MAAAHTFEVRELPAGVGHVILAEELGTFYFADEPVIALAVDSFSHEVRTPHVRQNAEGITLWFDEHFSGGKIKVTV